MDGDNNQLYIGKVYQINDKLDGFTLFSSFLLVIIIRYWSYISSFFKNKLTKLVPMTENEILLKENDAEIRKLTSERNKYSIKDDFAQYMKIERKIVKLGHENKNILEKMNGISNISIMINIFLLIIRTSLISYLMYYLFSSTIFTVPKYDFPIFYRMLAFPDVFFSTSNYREDVTPISTIVFSTITTLSLEYLVNGLKSRSYYNVTNDKKVN